MVAAAEVLESLEDDGMVDHVVHLYGVSWDDYLRILAMRGDKSGPRITYLEGTLEIMSPSRGHEGVKSFIGCLVEAWCLDRAIDFSPYGSWTLKRKEKKRGVEPDECYVFGSKKASRPHLAIEVEWSRSGLDKLDVYRKLGVQEVWRWRDGRITVHVLRGEQYHPAPRSVALPELDLDLLCSFLDRPTVSQGIRDFRAAASTSAQRDRPRTAKKLR